VTSPSGDATLDDVVINLPRRRGPKSYSVHNGVARTPAPVRLRPRPPHPADVAQSQLFEALLLAEIDDLEDRVVAVERRRQRRADRNPEAGETLSHELKQLRQRVTEARQLLNALHRRFPGG
jgi:hypothetical protein